jgi:hypothetical protein
VTPTIILQRILADTAQTLAGIEHRTAMYGGPESAEFAALAAVELRQRILRPEAHGRDPGETADAWHRFTEAVLGRETSTYLHVHLREDGRLAELGTLCGDAARWIEREYPAEWTP